MGTWVLGDKESEGQRFTLHTGSFMLDRAGALLFLEDTLKGSHVHGSRAGERRAGRALFTKHER